MFYMESPAAALPRPWPVSRLLRRIRGWMARGRKSDPACADDHLLRLAETSPHLLRDLGFVQDPVTGAWTDGRHRVEAGRKDRAADLLRAGRV